ncbi:MAG: GTP-dependent dephospho-CoA kinase family protein [Euryarchaeota archaeon]|nr:GTP-dependent dephospho-CoA kinase family protein [Euryarchaeota archaeon]
MKVLRLPGELRSELKKPLGKLYRGKGVECIEEMSDSLRSASKVIAVGDITTFCLLASSIEPDLCIVDNKTKRKPAPDHVQREINDLHEYETIEVRNPAATISQELMSTIRDALAGEKRRVKIFVTSGEEDLATLPAILYAPEGSVVVYGQPNEGSVLVEVTPEIKEFVKSIIKMMMVEE